MKEEYKSYWYCDNIVDNRDVVGLLHLGFPRCFVLIRNSFEFYYSTFDEFVSGAVEINWLDPSDMGNYTSAEKDEVLRKLWNFYIIQEEKEEQEFEEYKNDEDEEFQ